MIRGNQVTVSLTSVAAVCNIDRELIAQLLKDIFIKFIENGRKGRMVKLNLKIGHLVCYPNGLIQFENASEIQAGTDPEFMRIRTDTTSKEDYDNQRALDVDTIATY